MEQYGNQNNNNKKKSKNQNQKNGKIVKHALREKCPYSELFWSTFSSIRTEYGEILAAVTWTRIVIPCFYFMFKMRN